MITVWASGRSALLCQMLSAFLVVPRQLRWLPRVAQTGLTFGGLVCEGPWGCNVQQQSQLLSISCGHQSGLKQTFVVFCLSGFNLRLSHFLLPPGFYTLLVASSSHFHFRSLLSRFLPMYNILFLSSSLHS